MMQHIILIIYYTICHVCSETDVFIFARRTELRWANLSVPGDRGTWIPAHNLTNVVAVDFDENEGFVYWSDVNLQTLNRAKLDGTDQSVLFPTEIFQSYGLAVDSTNQQLYFTDTHSHTIKTAQVTASGTTTIISDDLIGPLGIVLNKQANEIFWSDHTTIEKSNVNGTARTILVDSDLGYPYALALDEDNGHIYWSDIDHHSIYKADIDGTNRINFITASSPLGLAVYGDAIYFAESTNKAVFKYTHEPAVFALPFSSLQHLMGLKASTLIDGKSVLFVSGRTELRQISLDNFGDLGVKMNAGSIVFTTAVGYDPTEDFVYWSDQGLGAISRVHRDGTGLQRIITTGISVVEGLVVCHASRQIFWTDSGYLAIAVSNMNGSNIRNVINNGLGKPMSITLDVDNRMVYWTDVGINPKIERATYDGLHRTIVVNTTLLYPNGIVLDVPYNKMYWGGSGTNGIEVANMDGSNRMFLTTYTGYVFGITLLDDYLYWTDWLTSTIGKINKHDWKDNTTILSADNDNNFTAVKVVLKYVPPSSTPTITTLPPLPPTQPPPQCRPCGGCQHIYDKTDRTTKVTACGNPKKCVNGKDKKREVIMNPRGPKNGRNKWVQRPTHCCYGFKKRRTIPLRKAWPCTYVRGWE